MGQLQVNSSALSLSFIHLFKKYLLSPKILGDVFGKVIQQQTRKAQSPLSWGEGLAHHFSFSTYKGVLFLWSFSLNSSAPPLQRSRLLSLMLLPCLYY